MTRVKMKDNLGTAAAASSLPSPNIWGDCEIEAIRNYGVNGILFEDDFLKPSDTTLEDGYIRLQTATGTVLQVASEADAVGISKLTSAADNDEAVVQLGSGLDVGPFRFGKDVWFEARVRVNAAAIVADDHSYFIGLATGGAAGAAIANKLFTTGDAIFATSDFCGFQHLDGESTALDAMYQAASQTKVDGAVNTDLDTVHTLVAATWVKLGFRYQADPAELRYYVNNSEAAAISSADIAAAAFPDATTAFMQPTIGIRGADATTATLEIDWWLVAQTPR